MNTTTQLERAIVTVEKVMDWAISSQAPRKVEKVQRLGSDPVGFKRSRSTVHLIASGDDIARTEMKVSEHDWKRIVRNSMDFDWSAIPATNIAMDIRETLEGLIKRPVV